MFRCSMACSLYSRKCLYAVGRTCPNCLKFFDGNAVAPTTRGPEKSRGNAEDFLGRGGAHEVGSALLQIQTYYGNNARPRNVRRRAHTAI